MSNPITTLRSGASIGIGHWKHPPSNSDGLQQWSYDLKVKDAEIKKQVHGFDGMERPYLMVPVGEKNGKVIRERIDMRWDHQTPDGTDVYETPSLANLPTAYEGTELVKKYGIQGFLKTNVGTLKIPTQKH